MAHEQPGKLTGDLIVAYGDRAIANIDDLHRLLTEDKAGVAADLTVIRGAEKLTLSVRPALRGR